MNKIIIAVLFLFLIGHTAAAQSTEEFEVVRTFSVLETDPPRVWKNSGIPNGFGFDPTNHYEHTHPYSMAYSNDYFYVDDPIQNRVIKFDVNNYWKEIDESYYSYYFEASDKYLMAYNDRSLLNIYSLKTQKYIIEYLNDNNDTKLRNMSRGDSVLCGDVYFMIGRTTTKDQEAIYNIIHISETGTADFYDQTQTEYFINEVYKGEESFTMDEKGYVFWDGKLITPNGVAFTNYYSIDSTTFIGQVMRSASIPFIGWDKYGNSYWARGTSIIVFNPNGEQIIYAKGTWSTRYRTQTTVTPDGVVYAMMLNEEKNVFELLKVEPFWLE